MMNIEATKERRFCKCGKAFEVFKKSERRYCSAPCANRENGKNSRFQLHRDQVTDVVRPPSDCKHHWVIDEANGPESEGRCKKCGESRMYRNSYEYGPIDGDHLHYIFGKGTMDWRDTYVLESTRENWAW